jgi:hypothetical protein
VEANFFSETNNLKDQTRALIHSIRDETTLPSEIRGVKAGWAEVIVAIWVPVQAASTTLL